jgi:flavin-dependent dehydrogenase
MICALTPICNRANGEGINTALKSGILAASAVAKAAATSRQAATIYLAELQPLISVMKTIDRDVTLQSDFTKRDKLLDQII